MIRLIWVRSWGQWTSKADKGTIRSRTKRRAANEQSKFAPTNWDLAIYYVLKWDNFTRYLRLLCGIVGSAALELFLTESNQILNQQFEGCLSQKIPSYLGSF